MGIQVAALEARLTADTSQARRELGAFGKDVGAMVSGYAVGHTLQQWGRSAFDFVKDMVTVGSQIEQTMVMVDRLTGGTGANVDALTDKLFTLDQQVSFGADEVAGAMEQLGREGFSFEQIVTDFTDQALYFAGAIREDVVQSANIFGNVMRIFEEQGLSAAQVADSLAQAILRSGRPAAEFASGMQYVGSVAAELNIPLEDTAAMLALLTREGIKTRSAGTGLRSMFLSLANPTEKALGALQQYGLEFAAFNEDGSFRDITALLTDFHNVISKMSDEDALAFLGDVFGKNAATPLLTLFREGPAGFQETLDSMHELGSAQEIMNALMDTAAGSIERMEGAWLRFKASVGEVLGRILRPGIDLITDLLQAAAQAPTGVQTLIGLLIGLGGALAFIGGTMMLFNLFGGFSAIGMGLSAMLAPLLAIVSPLGIFIGLLAGLAFVFKDDIKDGVKSFTDELGEFVEDITTVYDRLREGEQIFDPWTNSWYSAGDGASVANAAIRAFGSAFEDFIRDTFNLPNFEVSEWFYDVAEGADVLIGKLDDLATHLSAHDWDAAFADLQDIGTIVIGASVELGGDLAEIGGDIYAWVKARLFGIPTGSGVGSSFLYYGAQAKMEDITLEDVVVEAGVVAGEKLKALGGNLVNWVKAHLLGGPGPANVDWSDGTGMGLGAGSGNEWAIDLPELSVDVLGFAFKAFGTFLTFMGDVSDSLESLAVAAFKMDPIEVSPEVEMNVHDMFYNATDALLNMDWYDVLHIAEMGAKMTAALAWLPFFIGAWIVFKFGPMMWDLFKSAASGVWDAIEDNFEEKFAGQIPNAVKFWQEWSFEAGVIVAAFQPVFDDLETVYQTVVEWANKVIAAWNKIPESLKPGGDVDPIPEPWNESPYPWPEPPPSVYDPQTMGPGNSAGTPSHPVMYAPQQPYTPVLSRYAVDYAGDQPIITRDIDPLAGQYPDASAAGPAMYGWMGGANKAMDDTQLKGQEFATQMANHFQSVAEDATNFGTSAGEGLKNTLGPALDESVQHGRTARDSFRDSFIGIATDATNYAIMAGQGFAHGIAGGMAVASVAVALGLVSISLQLSGFSLYGPGFSIGSSLGAGVAAGIYASVGPAMDAAAFLVTMVNLAMVIEGAIASPSRLTREKVGRNLGRGVVEGLRDLTHDAMAAGGDLVRAAVRGGESGGFATPVLAGAGGGGNTFVLQGNVMGKDTDRWIEKRARKVVKRQLDATVRRVPVRSSRR